MGASLQELQLQEKMLDDLDTKTDATQDKLDAVRDRLQHTLDHMNDRSSQLCLYLCVPRQLLGVGQRCITVLR